MNTKFCIDNPKDRQAIFFALRQCFTISSYTSLEQAYEVFAKNFFRPFHHPVQIISKKDLIPKTTNASYLQCFNDCLAIAGVDLPVLLTGEELTSRTVMIVAEDPLRGQKDDAIVLSTPYGIHLEKCRNGPQNIYWLVIQYLIEIGYNVYCTDINKFWLRHKNQKHKQPIPGDLQGHFKTTLLLEIDHFQPELIITFGKPAYLATLDITKNLNLRVLPFIHPSWNANKKWLQLFQSETQINNRKASITNKLNYMKRKIDELQMLQHSNVTIS